MTPAVLVETFPCAACQKAYPVDLQHESGYCQTCIQRGRRFWLERWSLAEIDEIAHLIWDDVPKAEELAA